MQRKSMRTYLWCQVKVGIYSIGVVGWAQGVAVVACLRSIGSLTWGHDPTVEGNVSSLTHSTRSAGQPQCCMFALSGVDNKRSLSWRQKATDTTEPNRFLVVIWPTKVAMLISTFWLGICLDRGNPHSSCPSALASNFSRSSYVMDLSPQNNWLWSRACRGQAMWWICPLITIVPQFWPRGFLDWAMWCICPP